MLVSDAVGRALARRGPPHVFGLIGSGNFAVTNALVEDGAQFVAARHECGAVSMADAYAQVTGGTGMCSVHQGPGLTNTMTALTEAAKSRTPLVLLAGDTAASAIRSNFRIEQDQLVQSVGAVAERIHGPQTAVADALRALRRARVERRPVVLMLPLDIQAAECPDGGDAAPAEPPKLHPSQPARQAVSAAVEALSRAERPLIIAGRGAREAGAGPLIEELAERLGGLLATSAVVNGLFATNPWALGISGGFASPEAAELIGQADVVLAAGATLNMWTTRHARLLHPRATVIQIDHDPDGIAAHHRVDIALVGDVGESARCILAELAPRALGSGWRSADVGEQIRNGRWQSTPFEDASTEARIDPRALSNALDGLLPAERTLAIDSGHFMGYPAMYLRVPDERAFVFTQAFQAVGLGLASGIGAAVARPDRLTVAALGDGGAFLSLSDFETVARLRLRMLIVVYNDSAYGAEVHHFGPHGHPLDLVQFPETDFAAIGRAVGLHGATVRRVEDLHAVTEWLESGASPGLVLDAKVVPTVVAEWLEEAFRGH
ncbi:MAG: thiamine pyrophosphate-binding protein [Chloroflexi bacterium]|nr:thiamine pyrophosphate-binding protein [Chloroflexota bacterium]